MHEYSCSSTILVLPYHAINYHYSGLVMPALLLQKPSATSKAKDHNSCLSRRLDLWREERIPELVAEVTTIQKHLLLQPSQEDPAIN